MSLDYTSVRAPGGGGGLVLGQGQPAPRSVRAKGGGRAGQLDRGVRVAMGARYTKT
jgi:hypothetical protein